MDKEIEEACIDDGLGAARCPELPGGMFEVGVYRSVVHHAAVRVEAISSEAAHDHVKSFLDQLGAENGGEVDWSYARTDLGVLFVKREQEKSL